uniref:Uncharacterized protein n=1 Tax=Lactuca sativa TaxID=4236 RepID=A0A9R1VB03_LACSA|nr:hypothetical protein LSAT_V11C600329050 [Lactuca sativa]
MLDQLLLASSVSTSEAYSKVAVEAILQRVTKEHTVNTSTFSMVVSDSAVVCKEMTEKVNKLIVDTREFMDNYQASFAALRTEFKSDHEAFQTAIDVKLSKLQVDLAMESKIMDALALKEENYKVLETKLQYTQKQVDDLLAEKAVTQSCIPDVNGLLSDIIETRDPHDFHHRSSKVHSDDVKPKVSVKPPVIKQGPKDKETLFSNEPIIDDSEDEEPDEAQLKRRKAREA